MAYSDDDIAMRPIDWEWWCVLVSVPVVWRFCRLRLGTIG
jgi:hypothetical protein